MLVQDADAWTLRSEPLGPGSREPVVVVVGLHAPFDQNRAPLDSSRVVLLKL